MRPVEHTVSTQYAHRCADNLRVKLWNGVSITKDVPGDNVAE